MAHLTTMELTLSGPDHWILKPRKKVLEMNGLTCNHPPLRWLGKQMCCHHQVNIPLPFISNELFKYLKQFFLNLQVPLKIWLFTTTITTYRNQQKIQRKTSFPKEATISFRWKVFHLTISLEGDCWHRLYNRRPRRIALKSIVLSTFPASGRRSHSHRSLSRL